MSVAAAHASAFYNEVAASGRVWTLRDDTGFPAPIGEGGRAMPFWSSQNRVELIICQVPAYAGFTPAELDLEVFLGRWIPGLMRDNLRVGLNWSGSRAAGYDVEPLEVGKRLLTCVGADTRHSFVERRRASMSWDKAPSLGVTRPRAAQLSR
jgi:hypothetical protein